MVEQVLVVVIVSRQRVDLLYVRQRIGQKGEEDRFAVGSAIPVDVEGELSGLQAPATTRGRRPSSLAGLHELRTEERAGCVAFKDVVAVPGVASADLQRSGTPETRHELAEKRRVAVQLERRVGPVHDEASQLEVPAEGAHLADVVELQLPEAASHRKLPRDEGVVQHALPAGEVEREAVFEEGQLRPDFPFR